MIFDTTPAPTVRPAVRGWRAQPSSIARRRISVDRDFRVVAGITIYGAVAS